MRMKTRLIISAAFITALSVSAYSQSETSETDAPKKIRLDLPTVIKGVVSGNLEAKKAAADYDSAGTELDKFNGNYDVFMYGKANKQYRQLSPENPAVANNGYRVDTNTVEAGLQKHFATGTTFQAGISTTKQTITPKAEMPDYKLKGYNSAVNVGLSQELFKNAFGANERKAVKSLELATEIKQRQARQAIVSAVMDSFVAYWDVIIADENLKTATVAYNNTRDIRNLVRRKSSFGLSEKEELMDWEGRVLQFKNMVDGAQLGLTNARLGILRALDMDRNTEIEITQDLVTAPPSITYEQAMNEALKKRNDLANLRAAMAISENQYDIAKNNSRPSVTANAGIGYNDYNENSLPGSFNTVNRQWNIGITVSKSLGGTSEEAEERSARNALLKRRLEIRQLETGIGDEIRIRLDKCQTAYLVYTQTAQAADYARRYYESIYRKYEQGRYETTQLKLAFDNYINQRNNALKSLVDYNVALLELDVAKNTVFEKYAINVDALVAQNIKE